MEADMRRDMRNRRRVTGSDAAQQPRQMDAVERAWHARYLTDNWLVQKMAREAERDSKSRDREGDGAYVFGKHNLLLHRLRENPGAMKQFAEWAAYRALTELKDGGA